MLPWLSEILFSEIWKETRCGVTLALGWCALLFQRLEEKQQRWTRICPLSDSHVSEPFRWWLASGHCFGDFGRCKGLAWLFLQLMAAVVARTADRFA